MSNSVNLSVHLKKTFLAPWGDICFCSFDVIRFPLFPVCLVCFCYVALPSMWLQCGSHFWMWLMIDPQKWTRRDECSTFETTNLWFQNGTRTPVSRDFHMSKIHILHPKLWRNRGGASPAWRRNKNEAVSQLRYWVATSNCIFEKCEQSRNKN